MQLGPLYRPHIHAVVGLDSKSFRNTIKFSIKIVQRYRRVALDPIHAEKKDWVLVAWCMIKRANKFISKTRQVSGNRH